MELEKHKRDLACFIYDSIPLGANLSQKEIMEVIDSYIESVKDESQEDKQLRFDADEEERQFNVEKGDEL